jgi:hypothetical protein
MIIETSIQYDHKKLKQIFLKQVNMVMGECELTNKHLGMNLIRI